MPNRNNGRDTERYGGGQSGYGAGRDADRAMGSGFRNQVPANRTDEDPSGIHTDDRFTGRGGEGYWEDRSERIERTHYGEPRGGRGYSQGFKGGSGGAQVAHPHEDVRYPDMYGPGGNIGQRAPGGHRGKGPVGYTRSDDRIRETVCEALSDDDHVDASHIEVVVKNGEVLLTGHVDDRWQKRRAEDLIEHMPGVKDVQNQLRCRSLMGNRDLDSAVGHEETTTSSTERKHRA